MNAKVMLALAIVLSVYVYQQVTHFTYAAARHASMQLCLAGGDTQSACEMRVAGLAK